MKEKCTINYRSKIKHEPLIFREVLRVLVFQSVQYMMHNFIALHTPLILLVWLVSDTFDLIPR